MHNEASSLESSESEEVPEWKVTFHSIGKSRNGNFEQHFSHYGEHEISKSKPSGFVLTEEYTLHAEKMFRFQPKGDDVWVLTFPKCGKFRL